MQETTEAKKEIAARDRQISALEAQRTDYEQRMQDLRNSLREAEQNCNKMYANLTQSSSVQLQKLQESQTKFEEASLVISRQSTVIDELHKQVDQLREINSQLEYSWGQKYTEMVNAKDLEYTETCADYKNQVNELKVRSETTVRELKKEFQHDIGIVDLELKRQTSILKEQVAKLENKLLKAGQQNAELKNLLQMAVKSDTKKDSLIEELKA